MDFNDKIREFAGRIPVIAKDATSEEGTKNGLILPLFQILGYDILNPAEISPEHDASAGGKKNKRVDIAVKINGEVKFVVECKHHKVTLNDNHAAQLKEYFTFSPAKFGILTNGIIYRFYSDFQDANIMDLEPYLELNMTDLKDSHISHLKLFSKDKYNANKIFSKAEELMYLGRIENVLRDDLENTSPEFVKYILGRVYPSKRSSQAVEKFTPIIKNTVKSYINSHIKAAAQSIIDKHQEPKKIITTDEEMEVFYVIKGMLSEITFPGDIVYRDAESYFSILYKDNNRTPICRFYSRAKGRQLHIPDKDKNFTKYDLKTIDDIYKYKRELINAVRLYL